MNEENKNIKIGKYLCYVLRHHPESIGISLDQYGYANVEELVSKINGLSVELLVHIVATDNKQRYSFNENKTKIRANQG